MRQSAPSLRLALSVPLSPLKAIMNRTSPLPFVITTVLLAASACAHADGFYAGANLGGPDWHDSVAGVGGHGSGLSGRLYGGYAFTPHYALELGIMDLGHIRDDNGKVKAYGGSLDGVGTLPLDDRWSLLGRVGVAQAHFSTPLGSDSSPALKVGAGIQYDFNKSLALRGEYEHYRFSSVLDNKVNVGQFTVGLRFSY